MNLVDASGRKIKGEPKIQLKSVEEGKSYIVGMQALPDPKETTKMSNSVMKALQVTYPESKFVVIAGLQSVNELVMSKEELLEEINKAPKDMDKIIKDAIKGA